MRVSVGLNAMKFMIFVCRFETIGSHFHYKIANLTQF